MKILKCSIVFLLVQILFAFFAWLSGYNFDERGVHIAIVAFISLVVGLWAIGEFLNIVRE